MKILALLAVLAPLCLAAERGLPPLATPALRDSVLAIVAQAKQVKPVSMRIYLWKDGRFDLFETQRLIHVSGRREGDRFSFDGWVEDRNLSFMAHPGSEAGSFQFWGERVNLTLTRHGSSLRANGFVDGAWIDWAFVRAGDGFSVRDEQGAKLDIRRTEDGYSIEGLIDDRRLNGYGAAVLGGVVTVAASIK